MNIWMKANAIPQSEVKVPNDEFENIIKKFGVGHSCEWFGYDIDSDFAKETVNVLCEGVGIKAPLKI